MNKSYQGPMRFSHRGVVQAAPDNTIGAFQAAVDAGYEGIEIDIQMSRDGEIVVCHNSNLTAMTIGHPTAHSNDLIAECDWKDLCSRELPYANHLLPEELPKDSDNETLCYLPNLVAGNKVPYKKALEQDPRMAHIMTFLEFDQWMSTLPADKKPLAEIEFKANGMMPRLLEILEKSDNLDHYILFSGNKDQVIDMHEACKGHNLPGLRFAANVRFLTDENKAFIEKYEFYEIGLNAYAYTAEDVAWLKARGIETFSNLGDIPGWWEQMVALGTKGFKTNYPQAYTKWYEETFTK